MDRIKFRVRPNPVVDDFEVRIIVSGTDIIPSDMYGLDPIQGQVESLLEQTALTEGGKLWFARGRYETDDGADVLVSRTEVTVVWKLDGAETLPFIFNPTQYDEAVSRLRTDFSWETPRRTAERLIAGLDYSSLDRFGIKFQWASTRWQSNNGKIAMAFWLIEEDAVEYQLVCHVAWDQSNPKEAADNVKSLLRQVPEQWPDVVYYPQVPYKLNLKPSIAGPGWRSSFPNSEFGMSKF